MVPNAAYHVQNGYQQTWKTSLSSAGGPLGNGVIHGEVHEEMSVIGQFRDVYKNRRIKSHTAPYVCVWLSGDVH